MIDLRAWPGLRVSGPLGGEDVDLTRMPLDVVDECRAAWRGLDGVPLAVVHGDPGPADVRKLRRVDHGE